MKIAFRTDASLQIGTGHVMRCLTLAVFLRAAGAQCHFICRDHPGSIIELILKHGFTVSVLKVIVDKAELSESVTSAHSDYAVWLGEDWTSDAAQSMIGIGSTPVDLLIVDHYALDYRWEHAMRPSCRKLMVIDDLANRQHDCDFLLDQNLGRDKADYMKFVPDGCIVLTGPQYALLRSEFAVFRDESLRRRKNPQFKHLLIAMGGVDQMDATGKVLVSLMACSLPIDLHITVVMGPHSPWLERVQSLASKFKQSCVVKVGVDNMARLMVDSDLSIGAAGSTSWERCCLGLPTLLVVLAENQRNSAAALKRSGSVKLLNSMDEIPLSLCPTLKQIIVPNELSRLSQMSHLITDGKGIIRVKKAIDDCHD